MFKSAVISDCGKYRYHLLRGWDSSKPPLLFIMLNPSTADAEQDDHTIRKCIGFAQRQGYGSIEVVNLFAYRATDPKELAQAGWLVGPMNQSHRTGAIFRVHRNGGRVICAWGAHARGHHEARLCLEGLRYNNVPAYALRVLDDGTPAHPLMLPYSSRPIELT